MPGRRGTASRAASCPQPLALEVGVEARDELAIAVEQARRHPLIAAEQPFRRLAPARMRDLGVHIGPEAVFAALDLFPEADGTAVGEGDAGDRLAGLEAVFPRE